MPKKGKEQDYVKKTSLGPLRQGQRLDTSEIKQCSSKEHKPPNKARKPQRAPPALNELNFRERKPDSLHLCDSPKKRLSRAILVSSGTNPYKTRIKDELHNIITTSEYNSLAQAGYKSNRTESRKVKHLHNGSIEAKRLQLHRQTRA
jgi:hypothetical protein